MGIRAAIGHHAGGVRCLGCGATVPDDVGPIHAYMTAAPGCWARYCSLEDWKASLSGEEAISVVCDLVDCFAVQHATNPERRNRQSVALHLMSLCSGLERSASGRARQERIATWVGRDYPLLDSQPRCVPSVATRRDGRSGAKPAPSARSRRPAGRSSMPGLAAPSSIDHLHSCRHGCAGTTTVKPDGTSE